MIIENNITVHRSKDPDDSSQGMNSQSAYDYINDVRNPLPSILLINKVSREEALKMLAVMKWVKEFEDE